MLVFYWMIREIEKLFRFFRKRGCMVRLNSDPVTLLESHLFSLFWDLEQDSRGTCSMLTGRYVMGAVIILFGPSPDGNLAFQ